MTEIERLTDIVIRFRDERDWKQFHNPKDAALSLMLEAAEVLEHFQWKNPKEIEEYVAVHKADISEELADVMYFVFLMSHDMGIDLADAFVKKMQKNAEHYPVHKAKGKHVKYDKL